MNKILAASLLCLAAIASAHGQSYPTTIDTQYTIPIFVDNKVTYLTAAITDVSTSLSVASTDGFPQSGMFQIGNEWINFAITDGTHFGLWVGGRGAGGTVAAAHPTRAPVRLIYTALSHNGLRNSVLALESRVGIGLDIASAVSVGSHLRVSSIGGVTSWSQIPMTDLGTGTPDATKFLRGDRTWQTFTTGTVTGTTSIIGKIPKWLTSTSLGDSLINESGTALSATASWTISSPGTSAVPLTVKAIASQTADQTQWQDSAGTTLTAINKDGALVFGGDTNLYRNAANSLFTDDSLTVAGDYQLTGNFTWETDNTGDIGTSTDLRPRNIYAATMIEAPIISLGGGVAWTFGSAAPSGICKNGSLYSRTTTGNLYVCESGAWVIK